MKRLSKIFSITIILIVLVSCFISCGKKLPKEETLQNVLGQGNYKVVFEDQFEGDELDTTVWLNGYPTKDRTAAYYVEDAVSVKDGNLVITTNYREDGVYGPGWYTGWIESADSTSHIMQVDNPHLKEDFKGFYTTYGYFEARLKVPKFVGMWSAFWLMPCYGDGMTWNDDIIGTAADGVEIDIMESFYYSQIYKNLNTHVIHMDSYKEYWTSVKSDVIDIGENIYDEYHTYGVLWTDKEYVFYIDGKETFRTDCGKYGVSHSQECMLLTCEVPGYDIAHPGKVKDANGKVSKHWSGDASKNSKEKGYEFIVDYVRVWQQ